MRTIKNLFMTSSRRHPGGQRYRGFGCALIVAAAYTLDRLDLQEYAAGMTPMLADAGLPMLILVFPAAILLFLPIVVVETWFARHQLPSVSTNRRFAGVFAANAGSTIIGRPLTWIIMVRLQLFMIPEGSGSDFKLTPPFDAIANVIMGAGWLPPDEDNLHWMIPTAVMGLLIPAFFVSVFTEGLVLRDCWRETVSKERRSFVWVANFASYALLYAVTIAWLLYSIIRRGI